MDSPVRNIYFGGTKADAIMKASIEETKYSQLSEVNCDRLNVKTAAIAKRHTDARRNPSSESPTIELVPKSSEGAVSASVKQDATATEKTTGIRREIVIIFFSNVPSDLSLLAFGIFPAREADQQEVCRKSRRDRD